MPSEREASHSYLSTLNECRRKFYYRYERRLEGDSDDLLPFAGSVGHVGLAVLYGGGSIAQMRDAVDEAWGDRVVPAGHKHSHLSPAFMKALIESYWRRHANDGWEVAVVEHEFSVEVGGQPFKGIIDAVRVDTYKPSIVDFKFTTGWLSNWWASQNAFNISHQPRMYALAAAELGYEDCAEAYFMGIHMGKSALADDEVWANRTTEPTQLFGPFVLSPARARESLDWIEEGYDEIAWRRARQVERGEAAWPQNTQNRYTCDRCEFNVLCTRAPEARERIIARHFSVREERATVDSAQGSR